MRFDKPLLLPAAALAMLMLWPHPAPADTLAVLNNLDSGPGSLRDAIAQADDGDTIDFDDDLAGETITLTSGQLEITKSLNIQGPGAGLLAISGNDRYRVFAVEEGHTVSISGLTITHGHTKGGAWGAGIFNAGSTLTLANTVLSHNQNFGSKGSHASGGAVALFNDASLFVTGSTFHSNRAIGNSGGGIAFGGALEIRDARSTAQIVDSTFVGNQAVAGDGGVGVVTLPVLATSWAGAINNAGTLVVENSTFTDNQAIGGSGASGGKGTGGPTNVGAVASGAIANDGVMRVSRSLFERNQAIGGSNNIAATSGPSRVGTAGAGAINNYAGAVATITDSTFADNQALGGSHNTGGSNALTGGAAFGGAMRNNGALTLSNTTFSDNLAAGGVGNSGGAFDGAALGGGLFNQAALLFDGPAPFATISNCTFSDNAAVGGAGALGGNGGDGLGGGIYNAAGSTLEVRSSTVTDNHADGGAAESGGSAGSGIGGGLYLEAGGSACLDDFTVEHIFDNEASTSDDDVFGNYTDCE
jgi:hypothetical protein